MNHSDFDKSDELMLSRIRNDIQKILIPFTIEEKFPSIKKFFNTSYELLVNPTGRFVIGGPHGDTGLTGRKIIVDTYGGACPHGGGAFSGKDPTKVDRSATYMLRHIAKNIVKSGICKKILIQISYAIGLAKPISVFVDTYNTINPLLKEKGITDQHIEKIITEFFPLEPGKIIEYLKLRKPIYKKTAVFGHFGRKPEKVITHPGNNSSPEYLHYFSWEETSASAELQQAFNLQEQNAAY